MDFCFMLTRSDQTVPDALEVLEYIRPLGLRHLGFKDVGVPPETLRALVAGIREQGAISYMEVVSTSRESALNSARIAKDIGVQRLLGGTQVEDILAILAGSETTYHPFPGRPHDHPTKLGGSPADVEADCKRFAELGCAGVDLLAYRATEADPIELVKAARRGTPGFLMVAGSVTNAARISALAAAGADAFTIGSAAFDGSFAPNLGSLKSQLRAILDACK